VKYLKHPATIIATVALFIALGGGAAAYASGLINGSQIKNHSIAAKKLTNKAIKQLHGARGPAGPAGVQGIQGVQGVPGAKGDPGPIGPSNVYSSFNPFAPYDVNEESVGTLDLPAGNYFVMGNLSVADLDFAENTGCYLDDSNFGTIDAGYASTSTAEPGDQAVIHVQGPLTTTGSTVSIDCVSDDAGGGANGGTGAYYVHLSAIKVGTVTGSAGHFAKKAHSATVGK